MGRLSIRRRSPLVSGLESEFIVSIGFLFWLLMVLWLVFGMYINWPADQSNPRNFGIMGGNLLLFVLLFLIGWAVFGFVIQGPGAPIHR